MNYWINLLREQPMDSATVGKRIKIAREQKGITQRKLGEIAKITYSYLSLLEGNKTGVNIMTLLKIASALDIPPGYFLIDIPICSVCRIDLTFGSRINNNKEIWYCQKCSRNYVLQIYHTKLTIVNGDFLCI